MRRHASALLLGFGLFAASSLPAQRHHDPYHPDHDAPRRPTGAYLGGSAVYARPQGEFQDFVDHGFGIDAHFLYRPGRSPLGLRVDASYVNYGRERMTVPLSPTIGGRVLVDVKTDNNIAFLGVGPQLGIPDGSLRPYLGGFVGVSYFYTESYVEGLDDDHQFARTTNFDDATFSYGGRTGVYVPLRGGPSPISLDLGLTYRNSGEADYLREGDIHDDSRGGIEFTPSRSDTDLLTFHAGVSVGIAKSHRDRHRH